MTYLLVWEFRVHREQADDFERLYGPAGAWAELFAGYPGFLGTALVRDTNEPIRYVTIDRWRSGDDYAAFREAAGDRYLALDAQCEALTVAERFIGAFSEIETGA